MSKTAVHRSRTDRRAAAAIAVCGGALHVAAIFAVDAERMLVARTASSLAWLALGLAAQRAAGDAGSALPGMCETARARTAVGWIGAVAVVALGEAMRRVLPGAGDLPGLDAVPPWLALAVFAVLPGIGEELFFRGPALRAGARRAGPLAAWAVSTAAFAAVHPGQVAAAAVLGGALGALALTTGRVREAVAAHLAHNTLGLLHLGLGLGAS